MPSTCINAPGLGLSIGSYWDESCLSCQAAVRWTQGGVKFPQQIQGLLNLSWFFWLISWFVFQVMAVPQKMKTQRSHHGMTWHSFSWFFVMCKGMPVGCQAWKASRRCQASYTESEARHRGAVIAVRHRKKSAILFPISGGCVPTVSGKKYER